MRLHQWLQLHGTCTCNSVGTTPASPRLPAAPVPIGILPQAAAAISAALDRIQPVGGTPTLPALQGSLEHAKFSANANPGHKVAVVLATDGKPTECSSTVQNVAEVAAAGLQRHSLDSDVRDRRRPPLQELNPIASAAVRVRPSSSAGWKRPAAIRRRAEQDSRLVAYCEFFIPTPNNGKTLDYSKVNVQFSPPNGGPAQIVKQVQNQGECAGAGGGWYYDNAQNPTRIIACPQSCTGFNAQFGGQVDVLLGCKTITATPR